MSIQTKRWEVLPKAPEAHFDKFRDLPRLVVQILYNRGIFEEAAVYKFIQRTYATQDPFQMQGIIPAVERILKAIDERERIIVYGDYDADGVTATALLVQALQAFDANVLPYIPDRFEEGYGLNKEAIQELAEQQASLIITVDCGIRSIDEVRYGQDLGLHFIITDHHQIAQNSAGQDQLPPALAVINPKRADCCFPFKEFAGVGLAFKLVQALIQAWTTRHGQPPALRESDLLDLVSLGTVADMAPLVDENRILVRAGLEVLNQPCRPGVAALINQSRSASSKVTAGTIGFILGPRLNAAGRLTHARLAYKLLTTSNPIEAQALARELDEVNAERQTMTQDYVNQARDQILSKKADSFLHLVVDPDFNQGVVGLVASRLTDELYRPVLVAQQGEQFTKGSGRSIPEFDITRALDQCADLLVKYGGHAAAAGFTVDNTNLAQFEARLAEIANQALLDKELQKTLIVDAEINLRGVKPELVDQIENLQPFGYSNPTPKFTTRDLLIKYQTTVGRDGNHLKMKLFDGKSTWDAIGFGLGPLASQPAHKPGCKIAAVYTIEYNTWNGTKTLQLNLRDIRPSDA